LPEVDGEVGHTLIHYLLTDRFELIGRDGSLLSTQYRQSVLAFCAAKTCGITELEHLARNHMSNMVKSLSTLEIQSAMGSLASRLPHSDDWLFEHIRAKVSTEIANDNMLLMPDGELAMKVGNCGVFDRALLHAVLQLHGRTIFLFVFLSVYCLTTFTPQVIAIPRNRILSWIWMNYLGQKCWVQIWLQRGIEMKKSSETRRMLETCVAVKRMKDSV
jgi:hypothetical protein